MLFLTLFPKIFASSFSPLDLSDDMSIVVYSSLPFGEFAVTAYATIAKDIFSTLPDDW